jgi:hypothetical protein
MEIWIAFSFPESETMSQCIFYVFYSQVLMSTVSDDSRILTSKVTGELFLKWGWMNLFSVLVDFPFLPQNAQGTVT